MELAAEPQDVRLDCGDVDTLDCSAVQVLLALREALAVQGKLLELDRLSQPASESFAQAGLQRHFGVASSPCVLGQAAAACAAPE